MLAPLRLAVCLILLAAGAAAAAPSANAPDGRVRVAEARLAFHLARAETLHRALAPRSTAPARGFRAAPPGTSG